MIVIVGANGSGKSSMIKLFNRLYNPTSGTILLDGRPIQDYRLCDIRRGMAILRQDHTPYPLSIRDNIALGLPERGIDDQATAAELESAARLGGASAFIKKLKNGMGTVLRPPAISRTYFPGGSVPSLKAILSDRSKKIEISGGESQRLASYVHYTTSPCPGSLC